MTDKLTQSIDNLARALDRLGEALAEPESNPLAIDGTITHCSSGTVRANIGEDSRFEAG